MPQKAATPRLCYIPEVIVTVSRNKATNRTLRKTDDTVFFIMEIWLVVLGYWPFETAFQSISAISHREGAK